MGMSCKIFPGQPFRTGKKMKVNSAHLFRKQSAVNPLRANDSFDCSRGHSQRRPERGESCGLHLRQRLDTRSRCDDQIAWNVAVTTPFDGKVPIRQNCQAIFRLPRGVCEVPHFVRDNRLMLAILMGWSGRAFPFFLGTDTDFFQERLDGLFAPEKLLDRSVYVTRIAWLVDFAP
jgi:hypothetical protein